MFCKNCGKQLPEGAAACTTCGFAVGTGSNNCGNCGAQTVPGQAICTNCGASLTATAQPAAATEPKSKLIAALLALFLGWLGIHSFYLGYNKKGLIQLLVGVCCLGAIGGIWGIVDCILILIGKINKDASGVAFKE